MSMGCSFPCAYTKTACCVSTTLTVASWRYSSRGALMAIGLFPIIAALIHPSMPFMFFSFAVSGLIASKHKGNIERLRNGTESKIGEKKS